MATSKISATEGSGKNVATHSFTEDAITKEIQRIAHSTPGGLDAAFGAGPSSSSTPRFVAAIDPVDLAFFVNQAATGTPVNSAALTWPGNRGFWSAEGTWTGGGSIQLQWRRLSSTAWFDIAGATLSANGGIPLVDLPPGEVRAVLSGTVSSVSSNLQRTG
jgi:hypothetical protein